jgi:hypothetical protein
VAIRKASLISFFNVAPSVQVLSCLRSVCKVFGLTRRVQLIIWFAVIRKSLKKEIYSCDKEYFSLMENKEPVRNGLAH